LSSGSGPEIVVCVCAYIVWGWGKCTCARALARLRDKLCALSKHNWKLSSRWSPDRVIRLSHKNRPPHSLRALKDRTPPILFLPYPASPTVVLLFSSSSRRRERYVGGRICIILHKLHHTVFDLVNNDNNDHKKSKIIFEFNILFFNSLPIHKIKTVVWNFERKELNDCCLPHPFDYGTNLSISIFFLT